MSKNQKRSAVRRFDSSNVRRFRMKSVRRVDGGKERSKVRGALCLEVLPSVVEETRALIRAKSHVVKEVAEGDEYLPEGSGT